MGVFDAVFVAAALGASFLFAGRAALRVLRSFRKGAAPACAACATEAGPSRGGSARGAAGSGSALSGRPGCSSCRTCPNRSACPGG